MSNDSRVRVWAEDLVIPTWLPHRPDKNPMFLEKRVYQGSSGKVYPLPFTDRISETRTNRKWKALWLENEFLRVLVLPEIGGRIHAIQDKTNGYDLVYRQPVIKPALVGLAGPWISGGIEFNWPQHHRPATFLPVDFQFDEHPDGSKTIWCGDHDPMARMKGMHGVCLHPGNACVELKVRAYNRTPFVQTFLWWANVATRVHEAYQSFFPPDVYYIADHARRAMSEYPRCQHFYYGVNYGERGRRGVPPGERPARFVPPHCLNTGNAKPNSRITASLPDYAPNDLSFYANIPTPCSYMCMGSQEDFFGGYDFSREAGIIHVANHHIAPGKKQWTWGNHPFGYAWDRHLTDADATGEYGPYIELMAGVYTDNQPDFSFLQPGETRTWSQYWYPIQKIGPAQHANLAAAISLRVSDCGRKRTARLSKAPSPLPSSLRFAAASLSAGALRNIARLGVSVTRKFPNAKILLTAAGKTLFAATRALAPGAPLVAEIQLPKGIRETDLSVRVEDRAGSEVISYRVKPRTQGDLPPPATEPRAPADISSADELFVTGLHLEQYRHATRCPTMYWREALRRDPLDARCNNAMGRWHLRRGEFPPAEGHFRKAIERLTRRNPNPSDGEPFYNLGLALLHLARDEEAYAAFYKATWNQAWTAAACHALAEMDCRRHEWTSALEHLNHSLRFNADNLRARDLKTMVLRRLNRRKEADALLRDTLALDPLDWWARHLNGQSLKCDLQARLDIAHDLSRAGFCSAAIALLENSEARPRDLPDQSWGAAPLVQYTLGWLHEKAGRRENALACYRRAAAESPDYCFPSRLEEIAILEAAMRANPRDARAPYYLGNLLYDRRRHEAAIALWERSTRLDSTYSTAWRNLGIGYFNIRRRRARARAAYDEAFKADAADARIFFERDQLWKRLGEKPARRLRELEKHPRLVAQRDDLSLELCALCNQTGRHAQALRILSQRKFQPWEGGEGQALGQHVRTHLALGRAALARREFSRARSHFETALESPENLGEAKHLLANQSDIQYWLGVALDRLGERKSARDHWRAAAAFKGDFQEMSVRAFSGMTYYSALCRGRLGQKAGAGKLFRELLAYAKKLQKAEAGMDYFATSLPTMLLFEDDLQCRQETTALLLQAQAQLGLGRRRNAKSLLLAVLRRDPNHALAADLLSEVCGQFHEPMKRSGQP